MNYLELRSARRILEIVGRHNGELTWYSIVRRVDLSDVERDPPPYGVLKALVEQGLLATDPPEGGNQAKFSITERGRQLYQSLSA